jgi:hypothetical protein
MHTCVHAYEQTLTQRHTCTSTYSNFHRGKATHTHTHTHTHIHTQVWSNGRRRRGLIRVKYCAANGHARGPSVPGFGNRIFWTLGMAGGELPAQGVCMCMIAWFLCCRARCMHTAVRQRCRLGTGGILPVSVRCARTATLATRCSCSYFVIDTWCL